MKKFLVIWAGELISCIGSGMTAFALSMYVYQMTGSVSYVSLVTLLAYMPTILLSPIGGVLADRYDRRLLMIIGDAFSGLGIAYILWQIQSGDFKIVPILAGVTFNAVFVALLEPSYKATVTDLLSEEEFDKASGMVQMAENAKYLISPSLAGVLLGIADIRLILVLDIATVIVTVFTTSIVRKTIAKPVKKATKKISKEMQEGLHVITKNHTIRSLVAIMAFVCFFIGFVQTLSGPMLFSRYGYKNRRNHGICLCRWYAAWQSLDRNCRDQRKIYTGIMYCRNRKWSVYGNGGYQHKSDLNRWKHLFIFPVPSIFKYLCRCISPNESAQ